MTLLSVLILIATLQSPDSTPTSVRVFVFTATATAADRSDDEKERLAAVTDMRGRSRTRRASRSSIPADNRMQMEVLGREQREEPTGSFGGKSITRMGDTIIRLRVKSGEDESDLKGMGQGTGPGRQGRH